TVNLTAGTHTFEWTGFERGGAAGFELSVKVGSGQTGPVTTANGWHVLGDPSPDPAIALQGTIAATAYYSTGINQATIPGNSIGPNAAGTAALRNGAEGIFLDRTSSNTVGGTTAATRNVISGNNLSGVTLSGNVTTANLVEGNYIGLDKNGVNAVPN